MSTTIQLINPIHEKTSGAPTIHIALFTLQQQLYASPAIKSHADFIFTQIESSNLSRSLSDPLMLWNIQNSQHSVLVFNVGDPAQLTHKDIITLTQSIIKLLRTKTAHIVIDIEPFLATQIELLSLNLLGQLYRFEQFKSKPTENTLHTLTLLHPHAQDIQPRIDFITALHHGQSLARDLANQPANICHPEYMAQQALLLAEQFPQQLTVNIVTEDEMRTLGMHAFVAVSQGSARPGRLIILQYQGSTQADTPIALVGKGVTFDTGGISIKPAANMDEMKFDMSGAASVMGTMAALCQAKLPINVIGALACAENMPSSKASRPGDVVTSLSGQTIEILNTDAEGRLVLCDTLTYIKRFDPKVVIDIATLTGACIVALGKIVSGLFSNHQPLAQQLIQAGDVFHDRVWQMPLLDDYQELIDSPVADIANIGGPTAGAITAACFLSRFTKDYQWAHLDIAGISHISGAQKGATGRPVPLLMAYLREQAHMQTPAS